MKKMYMNIPLYCRIFYITSSLYFDINVSSRTYYSFEKK